jgi:hypothetical protein
MCRQWSGLIFKPRSAAILRFPAGACRSAARQPQESLVGVYTCARVCTRAQVDRHFSTDICSLNKCTAHDFSFSLRFAD